MTHARRAAAFAVLALASVATFAACSGGGSGGPGLAGLQTAPPVSTPTPMTISTAVATPTATPFKAPEAPTPTTAPSSAATASSAPAATALDPRVNVASGFSGVMIASVAYARQLAPLPNGDLLVGTLSNTVMLVPKVEGSGAAGTPVIFATLPETPAQSVSYSSVASAVYVATQHHVYKIPYVTGDQQASANPTDIVDVRTGSVAPNSDGDVHTSTSVAAAGSYLYVGVGSSCNACTETDATRAVVLRTDLSGAHLTTAATRIRNPIAIAPNPTSGAVWVAGAGQDCLTIGTASCGAQNNSYGSSHPYEYVDNLAAHGTGTIDYHWPDCEENQRDRHSFNVAWPTADCSAAIEPAVEFPSFGTHIGAVVYPSNEAGTYAFPQAYRNGLFVTVHGSWHELTNGIPVTPPNVAFVPMSGDLPATAVDWNNPNAQWQTFLSGFQDGSGLRIGRPTGVTVGSQGSLFVADDMANAIYRIRYGQQMTSARARRL